MRSKMRSIRTKVTTLIIAAILMSVVLVGGIAIVSARQEADRYCADLMNLTCVSKCEEINGFLSYDEECVDTVTHIAFDSLDPETLQRAGVLGANGSGRSLKGRELTTEKQEELDQYLTEYVGEIQSVFNTVANSNPNVLTYYMRINPELSSNQIGFWRSKLSSTSYENREITDIERYSSDDISHVGWYYVPLERGRPSWLDPYLNANLDKTIISYVAPLYRAGTFIGVIGIDVNFEDLTDLIGSIQILDSGYAFLTDSNGKIVYHPKLGDGHYLAEINSELEAAKLSKQSTGPVIYRFDNMNKKAVWGTLANNLTLVVSAPIVEINYGWYIMSICIVAAAVCALILFTLLATSLMHRIISPLEQLAEASKRLAAGDYEAKLDYEGNDEMGVLTQSFKQMQRDLRAFISDLNSKAYRDDLTGVKNKTALNVFTRQLDDAIASAVDGAAEAPKFAILMFDCNGLKSVNDNYGHERGDEYLRRACGFICKVYAHSPVFRMGGDEFVVILTKGDLDNADELDALFDSRVAENNASVTSAWDAVDIARGRATYDASVDENVAAVIRRADMAMYADKRQKKARVAKG